MKDLTVKAKPQKTMKDNIFMVLSKGFSFHFLLNTGHINIKSKCKDMGFPGGAVVENPPANAGDTGSSPGLGGSHMPRSN